MASKRKFTLDVAFEGGLHGVRRVIGSGSHQPSKNRIFLTVKFYADPDGLASSTVGGEKRGMFNISTLIPESSPKREYHPDEFDNIIENGAEKAVRGVIARLHAKSQGNSSSSADSSE